MSHCEPFITVLLLVPVGLIVYGALNIDLSMRETADDYYKMVGVVTGVSCAAHRCNVSFTFNDEYSKTPKLAIAQFEKPPPNGSHIDVWYSPDTNTYDLTEPQPTSWKGDVVLGTALVSVSSTFIFVFCLLCICLRLKRDDNTIRPVAIEVRPVEEKRSIEVVIVDPSDEVAVSETTGVQVVVTNPRSEVGDDKEEERR